MWFADLFIDRAWVKSRRGKLGSPAGRTSLELASPQCRVEFLLYGEGDRLRHVRVLMPVDTLAEANEITNVNVHRWAARIETATAAATGRSQGLEPLQRGQAAFAIAIGEGDETAQCVELSATDGRRKGTLEHAARVISAFTTEADFHLHFMARFVNEDMPFDVRWLNGYRTLEWHFTREAGRQPLAGLPEWRQFLERFREPLTPHLAAGQTLHGLIEQVRATVAHALSRPARADGTSAPDLALHTFAALEMMVMDVMNTLTVDGAGLSPRLAPPKAWGPRSGDQQSWHPDRIW